MNLENTVWKKETFKEFREYLLTLQDKEYKKFHEKLTKTKYEIIGIRVPILRKIAATISKGDYQKFLKNENHYYYEEVFIKAIVISKIKDVSELKKQMNLFVPQIDNWAICDSFCNSLKIVSNHKEEFIKEIQNYIKSKEEFVQRVGLILLLNFYIEPKYIQEIFWIVDHLHSDKYYVNMAAAWLLCECYIKEKEQTLLFLKENNLSAFVQNKTISKIKDSYRIEKLEKKMLDTLKK